MERELYSEDLMHVGVGWDDNPPGRGSGRYPYGSGKNPNQHVELYQRVLDLRKQGLSEDEIRKAFDMNTSVYRASLSVGKAEHEKIQVIRAKEFNEMVDQN